MSRSAVGLVASCAGMRLVGCRNQSLVWRIFSAKEADGFPSNWEHENQRSQSKGRDAYKVQVRERWNFLAAKMRDNGSRKRRSIGTRRPFRFSPGVASA